jgi:hypothetical protein
MAAPLARRELIEIRGQVRHLDIQTNLLIFLNTQIQAILRLEKNQTCLLDVQMTDLTPNFARFRSDIPHGLSAPENQENQGQVRHLDTQINLLIFLNTQIQAILRLEKNQTCLLDVQMTDLTPNFAL